MLKHIIRNEVLQSISSAKCVVAFLLCTALILISVHLGVTDYRADLREHGLAMKRNQMTLESQSSWDALADSDRIILKPPQVLSTVATGIQDAVGRNAAFSFLLEPKPTGSKYDGNPVLAIFGPLDLALVVKTILSLFAVLFTFDAITRDRMRGTLKLALSNQVPRTQLILGKSIGGFISLVLPLGIPFVMGLILLSISPDISFSTEDWVRLGIILLCFLLYLSVFVNLGIFISSRSRSSSGSLFILLFIWVMAIFVVPKASVFVARLAAPIPSYYALSMEKLAFFKELKAKQKAEDREERWKRENPYPQWEEGPEWEHREEKWTQDYRGLVEEANQEFNDEIMQRYSKLDSSYRAKRLKRQVLALGLSRISPASTMSIGVLSLARTGITEQELFLDSVRIYQPAYVRWVNKKSAEVMQADPMAIPEKPDLSGMPRHEYAPQELGDSLSQAITDIVVLVLMNIALFAGAYVSFLKYDVR